MNYQNAAYSVLSLFIGAGGLDLGFEQEGFQLLAGIDINPWCIKTLQKNRPHWPVILGDIQTYFPKLNKQPDVLLAGVPCQGFSLGGHRQANDQRNLLYQEVIRIAALCQPRIILIENVLNLRQMKNPHTNQPFTKQIVDELEKLGYQVFFDIFKVCYYGVPQTRRRFIFIAFKETAPPHYFLPIPGQITTIRDFLYELGQGQIINLPNHDPRWGLNSQVHIETGNPFNSDEISVPVRLSRTASDGNPIRSFDQPFPAIDTGTIWGWAQGNVVAKRFEKNRVNSQLMSHEKSQVSLWRVSASRLRPFTSREYARLQTFPDDWVFLGQNKRDIQLQIGNAVPVQFAIHLAKNIKIALECLDTRISFLEKSMDNVQNQFPLESCRQLSLF